jgi:hypothetical protein
MRTLRTLSLGVIGALVAATPLLAHHDWPVDRSRLITITGTVAVYSFRDPHVMIALDVQANGTIEQWKVGGSNKKYSALNGWDKNTLKPGDVITAIGFRFKDGSNAAQLQKIVMATGIRSAGSTSGRGSIHRQSVASVDQASTYERMLMPGH